MAKFLLVRFFQALVTLLVSSFVVFYMARLSGSPADMLLPVESTPAERQEMIERMGWDRPIPYQFLAYLKGAARLDFGVSLRTRRPVVELVRVRLFNSLRLTSVAFLLAGFIALPLGVVAAVNRGHAWDRLAMTFATIGQAVPSFWVGIMFILLFAVILGWLPTSGIGGWKHYVMPAVAMGWSGLAAGIVRLLRSSMLEVLDSEYVKLARLKGLHEAVVVGKHAARNALIPVVTFVAFAYGVAVASAITVEVVFNWPGLGRLAYESVLWRDYPVLQFTVLTWAFLIIVVNFGVDVTYVLLDPRIRI